MKYAIGVLLGIILCSSVFAGSPQVLDGIHKGNNGQTYVMYVATTPYAVYLTTDANVSTDQNFENTGTEDAYYDFDATVSTGTQFSPSASQKLNGYRTGANAVLKVGKDRSFGGKFGKIIYFRTPTATGTTISVTLLQSEPN